ncbi:cytochrome b/b6 domain-containing protein [Humitalea sp. 24SJ18S-53]|uniref:cytochrome b/b6 domain-containing protein n=1 Tax=Humitalea sp. 24SJ18S-53 TaxID=3422307 RepID=UPI003D67317C
MARQTAAEADAQVKVWDPWVRITHWGIVGLLGLSCWSAWTHRMDLHVTSGLCMLGLVVFRIVWGIIGSESARFTRFLKSPLAAIRHIRHIGRREPDTEPGHNAAGGWMVAAMLGLLLTQAVSGLFTDDQIFTRGPLARSVPGAVSDWFSSLHIRVVYVILAATALHVLAILLYRVLKGQDLVRPMITGVKRMPAWAANHAPRIAPAWLGAIVLAMSAAIVVGLARLG